MASQCMFLFTSSEMRCVQYLIHLRMISPYANGMNKNVFFGISFGFALGMLPQKVKIQQESPETTKDVQKMSKITSPLACEQRVKGV